MRGACPAHHPGIAKQGYDATAQIADAEAFRPWSVWPSHWTRRLGGTDRAEKPFAPMPWCDATGEEHRGGVIERSGRRFRSRGRQARVPGTEISGVFWSMMLEVPAATSRVRFRPYRSQDVANVAETFADAQARRFYPDMGDAGGAGRWIEWNVANYETYGFGLWVIEHRNQGWFLGDCGLTYQRVEGERWLEVGYHLQERHRGNGYAIEAGRACIGYAFDHLDETRICSIVDPENAASGRVAARLHSAYRSFKNEGGRTMQLYWSARP